MPGKNIKILGKRPLIAYSLQYARLFTDDNNICITTDTADIGEVVKSMDYKLPFYRPASLAGDTSGMYEVMLHALDVYEEKNGPYDTLVLLQPTSPFRKRDFFVEASLLFKPGVDMVVGVKDSKANPYFNLFEENAGGFLQLSKERRHFVRRQDAPPVFQYNGSLYIINTTSLRSYKSLAAFPNIVKYVMPENYSIDIDNESDWLLAEYLLDHNLVAIDGKY